MPTLTRKQLVTLLAAPPSSVEETGQMSLDGTTEHEDAWDVSFENDDEVTVRYDGPLGHRYERAIDLAGRVLRWDADTEQLLPATFEPLTGSYETGGKTRTYLY